MLKLAQFINYYYLLIEGFKNFFTKLFELVYIRVYLVFLISVNLSTWIFARYIDSNIDEKMIALHYSVDFGIDYYGNTSKIYVIPFLGLFIIVINSLLFNSISVYKDRRFLSHLLLSSAMVVNLILLASITMIYLINF